RRGGGRAAPGSPRTAGTTRGPSACAGRSRPHGQRTAPEQVTAVAVSRYLPHVPWYLDELSVFLDFDGPISTADVGRHLLARAAAPDWWDLHVAFDRGEIGSRECLTGQWALVDATEAELRAMASEVPVDPGFAALVTGLRNGGAEVTVVSDGFGFYV